MLAHMVKTTLQLIFRIASFTGDPRLDQFSFCRRKTGCLWIQTHTVPASHKSHILRRRASPVSNPPEDHSEPLRI